MNGGSRILKAGMVVAAAAAVCFLAARHVRGLAGPPWWPWRWRRVPAGPLLAAFLAAAIPFFAGQFVHRVRKSAGLALVLVMLSTLCLEIAAATVPSQRPGLDQVGADVWDPSITSYFTDAATFTTARDWLGSFDRRLSDFNPHSLNKPPGPILFYVLVRRLVRPAGLAAVAGGIAVGLLSTLSVLATYFLIRRLSGDRDAAFAGASFLALCPSLVLFLPEFDQVFPAATALLATFWIRAVREGSFRFGALFGVALGGALFFSYNFLVLGLYLGLCSLLFVRRDPRRGRSFLALAGAGLAGAAAVPLALRALTGFRPVAAFQAAWRNQKALDEILRRPYPASVVWDLADFALGIGWIGVILALAFVLNRANDRDSRWLSAFAVAQIAFVAASGALRTETARVWMFLLPPLMLAVGKELAAWKFWPRLAAYASLFGVTFFVCQNLRFVS